MVTVSIPMVPTHSMVAELSSPVNVKTDVTMIVTTVFLACGTSDAVLLVTSLKKFLFAMLPVTFYLFPKIVINQKNEEDKLFLLDPFFIKL